MIGISGHVADVATQSGERRSMQADLDLIADIRAGAEAMRSRRHCYLPRYEMESELEYQRRVMMAPWRPEFVDSLRSLASKPFNEDVTVAEDTPPRIAALVDDIDGRGNNLTRFAHEAFTEAVANGGHGIMVDYSRIPANASRADEIKLGARPFWFHVPISTIIALRTATVGGREVIVHVRYMTTETVADGFGERTVQRVQVLEPGTWATWEKNEAGVWCVVDSGSVWSRGVPLTEVPLVLFFTGQRLGSLAVRSALRDLADVQVELYRALSRQDEILTFCGSPMLAANGLAKPALTDAPIKVGPKTVLFAPPGADGARPSWEFVSPDAKAIKEIREQVESIIQNMHRLGMQPMVPTSGGVTATASAINAAKAHSALQSWANGLKDALEQAFKFTDIFLGTGHATTVQVFCDFASGDQDIDEAALVLDAQEAGVISKRTTREELRRRNILGPAYDPAQEVRRLAAERRSAVPAVPTAPADLTPIPDPPSEISPKSSRHRRRLAAPAA